MTKIVNVLFCEEDLIQSSEFKFTNVVDLISNFIIFDGCSGSGKTFILNSLYKYLSLLKKHCTGSFIYNNLIGLNNGDPNNFNKIICSLSINGCIHKIYMKEVNDYDYDFYFVGNLSQKDVQEISNINIGFWEETRKPELEYFQKLRFCSWQEKNTWFPIINEAWKKFHEAFRPNIVLSEDLSGICDSKNNKKFSFDKLSAGEKDFLNLISYILIYRDDLDIFLIDRPELYITQIEEPILFSYIKYLLPNTQVIAASNANYWRDHACSYERK